MLNKRFSVLLILNLVLLVLTGQFAHSGPDDDSPMDYESGATKYDRSSSSQCHHRGYPDALSRTEEFIQNIARSVSGNDAYYVGGNMGRGFYEVGHMFHLSGAEPGTHSGLWNDLLKSGKDG